MKIGVIILARTNSERFPGKVLHQINGMSAIGWTIMQLKKSFSSSAIIVATSDADGDDVLAIEAQRFGVQCYRGSLENVSFRFLSAAKAHQLDYAIRINADNIIINDEIVQATKALCKTGVFDFVSNVSDRTFPKGMSVEGVRIDTYEEKSANFDLHEREHVMIGLYGDETINKHFLFNDEFKELSSVDLSLDFPEDVKRLENLINTLKPLKNSVNLEKLKCALDYQAEGSAFWTGKHGPMLIAEIGGNHEGNFDLAKQMLLQAVEAGVDYVKFQIYTGDSLVSSVVDKERNEHFRTFQLSLDDHIRLADLAQLHGIGYLSSVWDTHAIEKIDPYLDFYKIGSGDLTCWPLIKQFVSKGKPILLSTGLCNLSDVVQTVEYIYNLDSSYRNPNKLCVMQCTAMYPIDNLDANLNVIDTLRDSLPYVTIGYSDHTRGQDALCSAYTKGAHALEFHFTNTRENKTFRDHFVSLTKGETLDLIDSLSEIKSYLGSNVKTPTKIEIDTNHLVSFRRSIYVKSDKKIGDLLNLADMKFLRPNIGLDPRDYLHYAGRAFDANVRAYSELSDKVLQKK